MGVTVDDIDNDVADRAVCLVNCDPAPTTVGVVSQSV
jgi:hypothetical protein